MAVINRAPFNALVDDSGNGTSGSIWNKAAIAGTILDPVDAGLSAAWVNWTIPAGNITNDGGVPQTFTVQHSRWRPIGNNAVLWTVGLNPMTLTTATNRLYVTGTPFQMLTVPSTYIAPVAFCQLPAYVAAVNSGAVALCRFDGGNWAAGGAWFFFAITIEATT